MGPTPDFDNGPGNRFSLGRLHMGGDLSPHMRGDKALMGGYHEGDIDLMEGDLTSIDYIIN